MSKKQKQVIVKESTLDIKDIKMDKMYPKTDIIPFVSFLDGRPGFDGCLPVLRVSCVRIRCGR